MAASLVRTTTARIVFLAILVALTIGLACGIVGSDALAQEQELTVHEQSVEIDFPDRVVFDVSIEAPEPIERLELRYRAVFDDAARAERPAFEPGTSVSTSYELDLRTRYLPPGIDVNYRWIATLESGEVLETEEQQFFFIDDRHDWQEYSEGDVSVYYYSGGSQFASLAMDVTNRTIDRFTEDFAVELEEPVNIVLYGSSSEFQQALPYNSPEWIGGFADPPQNLIVAGISPDDNPASEMGRMLTHEVVHLLVAQATLNPFNGAPRWLDEGLAINYQEVQEDRYRRVLNNAIDSGQLIPLPALRSSFPSDPDLAIQSYAQSESIVEFMIEEYGHETISAILETYREGASHSDAVERGIGMTLEEIDEEWKAWLDYDGDTANLPAEPAQPAPLDRVEEVLMRVGVMPVLVIGGMVVVVLGLVRMVRAVNVRDLDEDVSPDVEYYGQDTFEDDHSNDLEVPLDDNPDLPNPPR
jgi:hypothetical protein